MKAITRRIDVLEQLCKGKQGALEKYDVLWDFSSLLGNSKSNEDPEIKKEFQNQCERLHALAPKVLQASPGRALSQSLASALSSLYILSPGFRRGPSECIDGMLKILGARSTKAPVKLSIISFLGVLFEKLGIMVSMRMPDCVQQLQKLKGADAVQRAAMMRAMRRMVVGCGQSGGFVHNDIVKFVRTVLADKDVACRRAALDTLRAVSLVSPGDLKEIEGRLQLCTKCMVDEETRSHAAKAFGVLLTAVTRLSNEAKGAAGESAEDSNSGSAPSSGSGFWSLETTMSYVCRLFVRGSTARTASLSMVMANVDTLVAMRAGVAQALVVFLHRIGLDVVERQMDGLVKGILAPLRALVAASHGGLKWTAGSANLDSPELVQARAATCYVLRVGLGTRLDQSLQLQLLETLVGLVSVPEREINEEDLVVAMQMLSDTSPGRGEDDDDYDGDAAVFDSENISTAAPSSNPLSRSTEQESNSRADSPSNSQGTSSQPSSMSNLPSISAAGSGSLSSLEKVAVLRELNHLLLELGPSAGNIAMGLTKTLVPLLYDQDWDVRVGAAFTIRSLAATVNRAAAPLLYQFVASMKRSFADPRHSVERLIGAAYGASAVLCALNQCTLGVPAGIIKECGEICFKMLKACRDSKFEASYPDLGFRCAIMISGCSVLNALIWSQSKDWCRSRFSKKIYPALRSCIAVSDAEAAVKDEKSVILVSTAKIAALEVVSVVEAVMTGAGDRLHSGSSSSSRGINQMHVDSAASSAGGGASMPFGSPARRRRGSSSTLRMRAGSDAQVSPWSAETLRGIDFVAIIDLSTLLKRALGRSPTHRGLGACHRLKFALYSSFLVFDSTSVFSSFAGPLLKSCAAYVSVAVEKTSLACDFLHAADCALDPESIHNLVGEELPQSFLSRTTIESPALSAMWREASGSALHDTISSPLAAMNSAIALLSRLCVAQPESNQQKVLSALSTAAGTDASAKKLVTQHNVLSVFNLVCAELSQRRIAFSPPVVKMCQIFLQNFVASENVVSRRASCEALGWLSSAQGDSVAANLLRAVQNIFGKSMREIPARAGGALLLGCVARAMGGLKSRPYMPSILDILNGLLLEAADDHVRVCALHSMWLSIDAAGLAFASHAQSTLASVCTLLLCEVTDRPEIFQAIGRVVNAIVGSIGPELQPGSATFRRCTAVCAVLRRHAHPLVHLEAINFEQSLILFAPQALSVDQVIPFLCSQFSSPYLSVRSAALHCLRQLVQSGPDRVKSYRLEEPLFLMLDSERDPELRDDLQKLIMSLLETFGAAMPGVWLSLCKKMIQAAARTHVKQQTVLFAGEDDEDDDDEEDFGGKAGTSSAHGAGAAMDESAEDVFLPRWWTKLFAVECIILLMSCVESGSEHFDLKRARAAMSERHDGNDETSADTKDYLVLHLSDLVTMAFNAATSNVDALRPAGVRLMKEVVERFAGSADPDFKGHKLLEQYQAQVISSLRPAFEVGSPPSLTAVACVVLGAYISTVKHDEETIELRLLPMLTSILERLDDLQYVAYSERAAMRVQLGVISACANLYSECKEEKGENTAIVMRVLEPWLQKLRVHWMGVLRDYVVLSTQPRDIQKSYSGAFYTTASLERNMSVYYEDALLPVLRAASTRLGEDAGDDANILIGLVMSRISQYAPSPKQHKLLAPWLHHLGAVFGNACAGEAISVPVLSELGVMFHVLIRSDVVVVQEQCVSLVVRVIRAVGDAKFEDQQGVSTLMLFLEVLIYAIKQLGAAESSSERLMGLAIRALGVVATLSSKLRVIVTPHLVVLLTELIEAGSACRSIASSTLAALLRPPPASDKSEASADLDTEDVQWSEILSLSLNRAASDFGDAKLWKESVYVLFGVLGAPRAAFFLKERAMGNVVAGVTRWLLESDSEVRDMTISKISEMIQAIAQFSSEADAEAAADFVRALVPTLATCGVVSDPQLPEGGAHLLRVFLLLSVWESRVSDTTHGRCAPLLEVLLPTFVFMLRVGAYQRSVAQTLLTLSNHASVQPHFEKALSTPTAQPAPASEDVSLIRTACSALQNEIAAQRNAAEEAKAAKVKAEEERRAKLEATKKKPKALNFAAYM